MKHSHFRTCSTVDRSRGKQALATRARIPLVVFVLALSITGCAHKTKPGELPQVDESPHELTPDDWMVVQLEKNGPQTVINREQYRELRAKGIRPRTGGSMERRPPMLLEVKSAIRLPAGQVKTFMFADAPIERIEISGGAAEGYFTKPYIIHRRNPEGGTSEHKGMDLHLLGVTPGQSILTVEFQDGQPKREIPIEVVKSAKPIG